MKRTLILLLILVTAAVSTQAQPGTKSTISYDGLYIAKTGSVPAANIEIFTYLKFYDDGTVYLQAVSENDPQAVGKWFGKTKFSQKGTYKIDGNNIKIQVDNKESEDFKLEGLEETKFKGTIGKDGKLCMLKDDDKEEKCFLFSKVP